MGGQIRLAPSPKDAAFETTLLAAPDQDRGDQLWVHKGLVISVPLRQ